MRGVFQEDDRKTIETLFGRNEEIQTILSKLITKEPVFIVGYRRVGKSALAHAVSNLIVGNHFAHVYCESGFNNAGDIINRVNDTLKSKDETITESLSIGKLLVEIGFSKTEANRLIHEFEKSTIIILDEAQRVTNPRIIDDFLTWVTKHLGSTTRVIITGSEVSLLHNLFKRIHGDPDKIISIYPLEQKIAIDFILTGFDQNGVHISLEDAKEIYNTLGGTPGAIIAAAEHIILEEDVEIATEREKISEINMMIEELNNIVSGYTVETQAFVEKLSVAEWQIEDLSFFTEDERKLLEDLIRFGFIKPKGKNYIVYDPLIREALKEWGGV